MLNCIIKDNTAQLTTNPFAFACILRNSSWQGVREEFPARDTPQREVHGREMLLSGTIPHLRQLIQLYVSRIEVYPDHISATLNYLPALRAVGAEHGVQISETASRMIFTPKVRHFWGEYF